MAKYARLQKNGRPMTCVPSQAELSSGLAKSGWGNNGKIIFDTRAKAIGAGLELELHGYPKTWVYSCQRSRNGHVHLTTKSPAARGRWT